LTLIGVNADHEKPLVLRSPHEVRDATLYCSSQRKAAGTRGILRNIIRNALKFTGPGGRVLVGCRRRSALMKIEVHDTGNRNPAR
jgi:signal transduction histidine kinase